MVDKKVLIVTLALVCGAALVMFTDGQSKKSKSENLQGRDFLEVATIKVSDVDKIEVSQDNGLIELAKKADNSWAMKSGFPADVTKIVTLIESIRKSKIERLVTKDRKQFADFGIADKDYVSITAGDKKLKVLVGEKRTKGGQFLSYDDSSNVYLASNAVNLNVQDSYWEFQTLVDIEASAIKSIALQKLTVSREKPEDALAIVGVPEEKQSSEVKQLGNLLNGLKFQAKYSKDFSSAVAAFKKPSLVEVELFSGKKIHLKVGETSDKDNKKYFVSIKYEGENLTAHETWLNQTMDENSFEIAKWQADRLLKKKKDLVVAKKP